MSQRCEKHGAFDFCAEQTFGSTVRSLRRMKQAVKLIDLSHFGEFGDCAQISTDTETGGSVLYTVPHFLLQ